MKREISANIKKYLDRRELTQSYLIDRLRMSEATFKRKMAAGGETFTAGELRQASKVLGINVEDFFK